MITLSGFGYEEKLKVPSKAFSKTFKNNTANKIIEKIAAYMLG